MAADRYDSDGREKMSVKEYNEAVARAAKAEARNSTIILIAIGILIAMFFIIANVFDGQQDRWESNCVRSINKITEGKSWYRGEESIEPDRLTASACYGSDY